MPDAEKLLSDEDWEIRARPVYKSLSWLADTLRKGLVESDSMVEEYEALGQVEGKTRRLVTDIKALPRPLSAEAQLTEKRLRSAHRKCADVVKHCSNFYVDLCMGH